ncbi:hypothetical protein [Flavobacterium subsaxonicum]|uniref:Uncharacterized protein n=1 Tax=Flavobacterium subsaxonicum WB 4.1-42 = DSM 21790 TaxID=1121898 RepID=A0A0A2MNY6_9FLAO|nr:hypothetical protein [Flavobacterium subsaxonicum]KGO93271.1 hypothetical protein Q766_08165 [Flavobacterium subsaxonicum WB 4.1-42 = DSM 21790]
MAQAKFPFYEQLAFDFYRTTVLDSFPVKKKITVFKYILDVHPNYFFTAPNYVGSLNHKTDAKFVLLKTYAESQYDFDSPMAELNTDSVNKKQFRVKEKRRNYYPKLLITLPFTEESSPERIFININEEHSETLIIFYSLEFDANGKVVNWCRTEHQIYIEY